MRLFRSFERWIHAQVLVRPVPIVAAALALALSGAWVYFTELPVVSSRAALTDPSREFNRRARAYEQEFGERDDPLVLVLRAGEEGAAAPPDPPQREAMKRVASRWASMLEERPDLFRSVRVRVPPSELEPWTLLYLSDPSFSRVVEMLETALPLAESAVASPNLSGVLETVVSVMDTLSGPEGDAEGAGAARAELRAGLGGLETGLARLRKEIEGDAAEEGDSVDSTDGLARLLEPLAEGGMDPDGYFFTSDGRLLTAVAVPRPDSTARLRYAEPVAYARAVLDTAMAEVPAGVTLDGGLAGEPALEQEEVVTTQQDFQRGALLALLVVSMVFMWAFRTILRPLLAAVVLGMSIATTFLVAWLAIGHLNAIAMVFAVILVALGVDFGIHFYTHYRRGLADGLGPGGSIRRTQRQIGGALWMDGVATAGAFLVAWFTDFPGLAELGIIAGTGLLLCLASMYLVFPALLVLVDRRWPPAHEERPPGLRFFEGVSGGGGPGRVSLLLVVAVALSGFVVGERDFDTNLLELQPVTGSAWRWQNLLLESDDRTQFAIATYEHPDSLRRVRRALEALPEVRSTETVLPHRPEEKRQALAPLCEEIGGVTVGLEAAPDPTSFRRHLFRFRSTLRRYSASGPEAREALAGAEREATALYRVLNDMDEEEARQALAGVQRRTAAAARGGLDRLRPLLCPPPFRTERAPDPLRARYVGSDGTLALFIHPAENTWEGGPRRRFISAVRGVEPAVFGGVVGFHENTRVMIRSFVQAALYSALVILLLLLAWTRSPRRTLLALLPLATGLGLLLLTMRWAPFDLGWNLANFFSVPILMGIGVAGGIHLVGAWRLGREPFRGALAAVTLSSLTTMIGFGMLTTGAHRGVASLGLVILLGMAFNLLACLFLLPAALRHFDPARQGATPERGRGRGGATALLLAAVLAGGLASPAPATARQGPPETPSFLMVKPGDPAATPRQAEGFLTDLSRYLGREVERFPEPPKGHIANTVQEGARLLASEEPVLAFVPAGFYLGKLRDGRTARPVAQTPRFGTHRDRYYLVTARGGPDSLRALRGRRVATAFDVDRDYLRRVVLPADMRPGDDFTLDPAENLADAVFHLLEGDSAAAPAILLDEELKRFFQGDDLVWPELKVIWTSDPLPRELVVALGPWHEDQLSDLRDALFGMKDDASGERLLGLMDSSGFEPVDRELLARVEARYDGGH